MFLWINSLKSLDYMIKRMQLIIYPWLVEVCHFASLQSLLQSVIYERYYV